MTSLGVLNFAYGTGPYLRTTELAIAFNNELERQGQARMRFVVPLVYGEKQRRIMLEEFAEHDARYAGEIVLDETLGALLREVFYADSSYQDALCAWVAHAARIGDDAKRYLSGTLHVSTLGGEPDVVDGRDVTIELNRSPRVLFGAVPAYMTTFGYIGEILEEALRTGAGQIHANPELLKAGIRIADAIESVQHMRAVAYPATFSGNDAYRPRYANEILTPPITGQFPALDTSDRAPGIYVTVTGIPGLERLYTEARAFGYTLYTSDPEAVPGGIKALPAIVTNQHIAFQFARSGWGSVWLSMHTGTPIIVPGYDPYDDPEIYYNNVMVEKLGIGIVYRGQPLKEILAQRETIKLNCAMLREQILARWQTLNGNEYCAALFVEDFLKRTLKR